ncbi:MAG: GTP-binding protein [Lachnospiraceae bacterium]|nr:GTP-binding protein [Lachnospiraceae bacterium]
MTKIDIISGFLGAGKTTLIKKLLEEAYKGEKVVLIENEFGEIGIDGGFLKDAGVEITEMNSGCICCSLVGDFGKSLKEVLERFSPDRVIIEPSGVGKLSDVIKAVQDVQDELPDAKLNSFSTVVDVSKAAMYMKNFGEFFNNQVESAKTIILSRTQKYDGAKAEVVVGKLRAQNPKAILITTAWDEIDGKVILSAMEQQTSFEKELLEEAHHHHEHHHEHGEDCTCGCHDHDHEHHHGHHHHDHEEHEHHHHEHHHEHGEDCTCGCHDHDHEHHHEHGEDCTCGCHDHDHEHHHGHHHHHADEVFTSWGKETPHKYERETMREILNKLANTEEYGVILRAKGMVPATDGTWIYFDLTPGEFELREGQPDYTGRLCVIGSKIKEDALEVLFELA